MTDSAFQLWALAITMTGSLRSEVVSLARPGAGDQKRFGNKSLQGVSSSDCVPSAASAVSVIRLEVGFLVTAPEANAESQEVNVHVR